MTAQQQRYQELMETKRANLAKESETHRSNVAEETETNRSNVAREKETHRHNKQEEVVDAVNAASNLIKATSSTVDAFIPF